MYHRTTFVQSAHSLVRMRLILCACLYWNRGPVYYLCNIKVTRMHATIGHTHQYARV